MLGYSMLFGSRGVAGAGVVGALSAVAAIAAFAPLARVAAPSRGAAAAATWLFGAGVLSNVVIGRMPFTLGIALGRVTGMAVRRARRRPRAAGARCGALARLRCSRVRSRARFWMLAAAARAARTGRDALGPCRDAVAVPVAVGGATMALLFPEGGDDRFVATAFWPMLAVPSRARCCWPRAGARCGRVRCSTSSSCSGAFVIPTPFGRTRCGCRSCSGRRCRPGVPRAAALAVVIVAVLVALVYLQWLPAVRAVSESYGDPSTEEAFFAAAARVPADAVRPGERVEVAFTHTTGRPPTSPLRAPARGWERQLDEKAPPRCSTTGG